MNDEEFIKEAREGAAAPIQNSFGADCLRETLDRLADANKRIEELEKLARWAVKAKANLQIRSEGRNWIGPLLKDYPQAEGEK